MELPEDYFCPRCNTKATKDLMYRMRAEGMPLGVSVHTALIILLEAKCPQSILQSIVKWAKTYLETGERLTEEEKDKLKLLAWKRAVNPSADD
jgi:hypothetical protein